MIASGDLYLLLNSNAARGNIFHFMVGCLANMLLSRKRKSLHRTTLKIEGSENANRPWKHGWWKQKL